jgi:hypothetical protein
MDKNQGPGSGVFIPDPQHSLAVLLLLDLVLLLASLLILESLF